MSTPVILKQTRIREGVWEGILSGHTGNAAPELAAHHMGEPLDDLSLYPIEETDGSWLVKLSIPVSCLNEGVQSFVIDNLKDGETLTQFTIVAGAPIEEHIVAEVSLLRAELDMLKRAFRRHCADTT